MYIQLERLAKKDGSVFLLFSLEALLLMEEIPHHLGCINLVNNGINYLPTRAGFLPSTVSL